MKKSKPKQRTNWKQRALLADERATHCESVIRLQNQVAKVRAANYECVLQDRDEFKARAESAEKHNALLLEEREASKPKPFYCEICGTELIGSSLKSHPLCTNRACYVAAVRIDTPPTHWQRFKSWLSRRGK